MKKLMIAAVLASVSGMAMANVDGVYVQGNVGASKLQGKINGDKAKDSDTAFAIAVGHDMGNVRYALDYTNYGKLENKESISASVYTDNEIKVQSVGVSAIYDFDSVSGVTPYAGVRAAINQAKINEHHVTGSYITDVSNKKNRAGIGAVAGVQYAINPSLAVDGAVHYNYLGKFDITDRAKFSDNKMSEYGASIGLRYNF